MIRWVVIVALVACGNGDKCERMFDKLGPAMEKELGHAPDRAKMVGQCKDGLAKHPEQEKMLDCIVGLSGTPSMAELDKCAAEGGRGDIGKSREKHRLGGEAGVQLDRLGKNAKRAFAETGAYPKAMPKVGPAPVGPCCTASNAGGKCPVDAKAWTEAAWKALEFSVDEPSAYSYSYESDGKTFTALAVGDADCDLHEATFTMKGAADGTTELTQPPKGTY